MVAGSDGRSSHLSNSNCDCLSLGCDQNNLGANFNARLVSEDAGKHELGAVADSVDTGVFDDNARMANK